MEKIRHSKISIIVLILLMCAGAALAGWEIMSMHNDKEETEEAPPPPPSDPLTGALVEDGFDETALQRRIVAFVVENTPDARPQWGMDDENYPPDILLQGEVEGGITRTLWLYSDYKKLPEVIGPMRSARPPYIKFSQFWDAVFIHWGMSHSKGNYIGANKIFEWYGVDHLNQMTLDDKEGLYDRDTSRGVSGEHTGIVYTDKLEATMKNEGFRETPETEYMTKLYFNETATPPSTETAEKVSVIYSKQTDWETTDWTYNQEDEMYHTSSFDNDFKRDNLLILYDETEYITKDDYQGAGGSVTYCDYLFKGGKAQLFSKGAVKEIKWERRGGKLLLIDPNYDAKEVYELNNDDDDENDVEGVILAEIPLIKDEEIAEAEKKKAEAEEAGEEYVPDMYVVQPINKGRTWIGWVSSNNGANITITPGDYTITMPGEEAGASETGEGAEAGTDKTES